MIRGLFPRNWAASIKRGWRDAAEGKPRKRSQADADREDAARERQAQRSAKRLANWQGMRDGC